MNLTTQRLAGLLHSRKTNIFLLAASVILLSLLNKDAAAQTEPTVWAHNVSWTTINNHNHTQRRDFPLGMGQGTWPGQPKRTGDQTAVDYATDCSLAQSAGIDAFAVDLLPGYGLNQNEAYMDGSLSAAATVHAESGKPFYISPCIDTPGQMTPAQLVQFIQGLMAGGRAQRPEWPKVNGVPVVWTYNATVASSAYWQETFSLLNSQGIQVDIMLDATSVFTQANSSLPTADLDAYANLPVGLYSFSTNFDQTGMGLCRQYLAGHHPASLATQLTVGTVWPGYWNENTGWYVDPQGSQLIRNSFAAAASSRWITVTTWNDYAENTHFEPSISLGTGRLDLLHSLISAWRGESWPSRSQFYVWQPNEIHSSEPLTGEALALVAAAPATVQVNLCDDNQKVLAVGTPMTFTTSGVHAMPYTFAASQLPAGHCTYLSLICQAADTPSATYLSEPIPVWQYGDNPLRTLTGVMWQAGMQVGEPAVTVTDTNAIPELESAQYADLGGQFFPRLNFNLLTLPQFGSSQFTDDIGTTQVLGQYAWDIFDAIPASQRWGFFDAKGVDTNGVVHWSPPTWVSPQSGFSAITSFWHFDEGAGTVASDASLYSKSAVLQGGATWSSASAAGPSCLVLDGQSGSVSVPQGDFPRGTFTIQAQIKPTLSAGDKSYTHDQTIFSDVAGALTFFIRADGRLQAQRIDGNGWEVATGTTVVPANQWSLVTATYDQQMLRVYYKNHLEAMTPCTGTHITTTTTLGYNPFGGNYFQGDLDEMEIQSQVAAPAGSGTVVLTPDQQVNLWHFDEGTGTVANNATPYTISLTVPSNVSWCTPGQTGAACLSFDGQSSRVSIPQGDFPHGTFTFQTQVKPFLAPGVTAYGHEQYLFGDLAAALSVIIRADGRLQVQRMSGNGWAVGYGKNRVLANQWSQVTVTYDLQTLKVYLNGALEASVGCTGTHVNTNTALGCNPYGGGGSFFQGDLDEVLVQPTVIVPGSKVASTPLTPDQQVNLWHFDEGAGTVADNATREAISLTVPPSVSWCTPGQTGAACLSFDGQSSHVSIPQGDFPHGTFTFQTQVKPFLAPGVTAYGHEQYLFGDLAAALSVIIRADGRLQVQRMSGNGWAVGYGKNRVLANQWSQVTVTYDLQTLKVYLNGALEASVGCTGTHVNTNTALGCNPYGGGGSFFQGDLDEVLIQPTVIVPGSKVASTPLTPDQQVNLWHFDEGAGTVASNATQGGISLAVPPSVSWCTPGQTGAACLSFDGQSSRVSIPQGDFPHGTFTFQTEVQPFLAPGVTAYGHDQYLFSDVAGALVVLIRADGRLQVQRTDANGWAVGYGKNPVPANQWSQVTVTYDLQTLKVYLNGALEASAGCTGTHVNTNTALGCNPYGGGGSFFQGNLDEVLLQP